jgi:hypothetical protein
MVKRIVSLVIFILLWIPALNGSTVAFGLDIVEREYWTETAVRKVLHIFAYGGYASDEQITLWSEMDPQVAVREMLTFEVVNDKLSPVQDATASNGGSLEELQSFWSSDVPENPTRPDMKAAYSVVTIRGDGWPTPWIRPISSVLPGIFLYFAKVSNQRIGSPGSFMPKTPVILHCPRVIQIRDQKNLLLRVHSRLTMPKKDWKHRESRFHGPTTNS